MKKIFLLILFFYVTLPSYSQDDEYQKYLESVRKEQSELREEMKDISQSLYDEYKDYKARANAEFADFIAKEWSLFEEFKTHNLSMSVPKIVDVPKANKSGLTSVISNDVNYKDEHNLPQVSNFESVNDGMNVSNDSGKDNYVIRKTVTENGVKEYAVSDFPSLLKNKIVETEIVNINFYGRKLNFSVDEKLRVRNKGIKEADVADYFKEIAKLTDETSSLWNQIDNYVKEMGLNDWGYFCILRSLSESLFSDIDNRVLFTFYMLRNEGSFKVKTARGKDSNKLTLLIAIDNNKEVYSYSFFRFKETDGTTLKYYSVYGGGNPKESIYTYDHSKQDDELKQLGLDFNDVLNMGPCDVRRELTFEKVNKTIELPYNSAHIAYLNDVPMTIFPIYFASPISIEAQQIFNTQLNELKQKYSPVQFIDILLNFVQTAFNYKTDEQQFGYEKYFYPEEVIAYPYSDCEDRSALFAWLVSTYTDAKVLGLQYDGHIATAVCFGENVDIDGDSFPYAGKRYYVCDPTYINASIGMSMPQFKDKMPKIIKMR